MKTAVSTVPQKKEPCRKKKIMVVDDEHLIRSMLTCVLEGEGFEVIAAENLANAEAHLLSDFFDLVVTDIMLSGAHLKEGLMLARNIQSNWPETRVIVMTGCGIEEMHREALQCGALWFCEKPFDIVVFAERAKDLLQNTDGRHKGGQLSPDIIASVTGCTSVM